MSNKYIDFLHTYEIKASPRDMLFFFALLLTSIGIFVPLLPNMPNLGLDPSWQFAMNQAVSQGLAFGREIVFTFGPYSSVFSELYHPATDNLMIYGSFYLAIIFTTLAFRIFKSRSWVLKIWFIFMIAVFSYSRDGLLFSFGLLFPVYVVMHYKPGESISVQKQIELAIFMSVLGFLPLVKGSLLVPSILITGATFCLFLIRHQWQTAMLTVLAPAISAVCFWLLSGQQLFDLPRYCLSMIQLISGYSEAMALQGALSHIVTYLIAVVVLLAVVFIEYKGHLLDKLYLLAIFALILFLTFKAGFTRHDQHSLAASVSILLAATLTLTWCSNLRTKFAFVLALLAFFNIDASYGRTNLQSLISRIDMTYRLPMIGLHNRLIDDDWLSQTYNAWLNAIQERDTIPELPGSVDIYSYEQSQLLASGNTWTPRPVIQSYSSYTPNLIQRNKDHLTSDQAPDYLLFSVQTIDFRFPAIDDGSSWPTILANYTPQRLTGNRLVLQRQPGPELRETIIGQGTVAIGDIVELPENVSLMAKINLDKTFLGKLASIFYKPSQLVILVQLKDGSVRQFRLVSTMVKTGFLISPLIENSDDFLKLYGKNSELDNKQVVSFRVIPASYSWMWKTSFDVEFAQIDL